MYIFKVISENSFVYYNYILKLSNRVNLVLEKLSCINRKKSEIFSVSMTAWKCLCCTDLNRGVRT